MTDLRWSSSKSEELKSERGVSFEEIILARLVGAKDHPSRPNQSILLFELQGYIWVVPYVIRDDEIFLKTLFPSRKYTKLWKQGDLE
ncbi:MAG: toxin [Elusimicrobia bacterium]|nr:toxin [Elusimicrobiota bacterium]